MTPEEAATWAAENPRVPNPPATLSGPLCEAAPDCLAPPYLDGYCHAHWRLLIGYAGHARQVSDLERMFSL